MNPRSYLYVPGSGGAERLARAGERGADAVIFDLEDSVAVAAKEQARSEVAAVLRTASGPGLEPRPRPGPGPAQRWVRVNATTLAEDIAAVVSPALTGVVVPKASPALLLEADAVLTSLGAPAAVIALIESAEGLATAGQVAAAPRVVRLGLGEADLIGELGLQPGPDRLELTSLRLQVVLASAIAGLAPPIGPVSTNLADSPEELVESTRALLRLGFRARTAIHPRQVATINNVFTPTPDEVSQARAVIATLGSNGVAVDHSGRMIDAAVVRSAQEVLSRVP